jgi:uncharacterized membrane protein
VLPGLRHPLDVLTWGLARPAALPLVAGALAFVVIARTLLVRAASLQLPAYDTAFFEQVVWNLGHGHGPVSGYTAGNFFGLHFSPLLVVPAALEVAWPDARLLAILHAAALALSAPAAYVFFRAILRERPGAALTAAALAAPLPFWAAMQQAAWSGFHTEALALPLVLLAGWAGLRGRSLVCWACALAALCAKEDQAYAVAVIGVLLAVYGPSRRQGVALAGTAVLWGLAVELVVMPLLRGPVVSDVASYYSWLRHPATGQVLAAVTRPAGWVAAGAMVAGMAGLPLLRPAWLLLALPPLLGNLLSAHYSQPQLFLQYALPLVVPVLVAGGLGARRLLEQPRPAWSLAALALPALVIGATYRDFPNEQAAPVTMARLLACTAALPATAPLAVDDAAAAPLAARPLELPLSWATPSDWVVVDRSGVVPDYVDARARRQVLANLAARRELRCDNGRFQLWAPVSVGEGIHG